MDDHSSGMFVTEHLVQPTRTARGESVACVCQRHGHAARFLFGLAPDGVCPAAGRYRQRGALLPHLFTLTCHSLTEPPFLIDAFFQSVSDRRSVFCGTVPEVAPAGRYPASFSPGARTFLPSLAAEAYSIYRVKIGQRVTGGHPAI